MLKFSLLIIAIAFCLFSCNNHSANNGASKAIQSVNVTHNWQLIPFVKIDSVNPILTPGKGTFLDPILHKSVLWEEKDVFNPAIVDKDGKIYML